MARSADYGVVSSPPAMDWPAALARKQQVVSGLVNGLSGLLKARGVDIIDGYGRLIHGGVEVAAADGTTQQIEARNVIMATGSVPRSIPGYDIDGTRIVTSDHALDWPSQPSRVAIIGGGVIGCEFASLLSEVGTKVHLFEALDSLLPGTEPEAVKALDARLQEAQGQDPHRNHGRSGSDR